MTLNFDPVTLTFDLWPWTFVVRRLCRSETLYKIWPQSGNPRRSYCSLNIWPYDLEHVSRVALCCGIVCTKFKLSEAIRSWNVTIFNANTSCYYMTLTFDPSSRTLHRSYSASEAKIKTNFEIFELRAVKIRWWWATCPRENEDCSTAGFVCTVC